MFVYILKCSFVIVYAHSNSCFVLVVVIIVRDPPLLTKILLKLPHERTCEKYVCLHFEIKTKWYPFVYI